MNKAQRRARRLKSNMASAEDDYEWQPPTEAEMKILQAKRERSNRISKLMGDYLLKGYKMLGSSCPDCGTIYLQDKQKKNYCVSCNELASDTVKDDPALNQEAARRQAAEEQQRQPAAPIEDSPETEPPLPLPPAPILNGSAEVVPRDITSRRTSQTRGSTRRSVSECGNAGSAGHAGGNAGHAGVASSYSNHSMHNSVSSPAVSNLHAQPADLRGSMASLTTLTGRYDVSEPLAVVTGKLTWATGELQRSGSVEASIQLCQLVKACAETLSALHSIHAKD